MAKIKVGILGSNGRMGKQVSQLLKEVHTEDFELTQQVDSGDDLKALLTCDVVIDFSLPEGTVALANAGMEKGGDLPAIVTGTTGWNLDLRRVLEDYTQQAPVLLAANFSIGIMALQHILRQHSQMLEDLKFNATIIEAHHKEKRDTPSGTAKSLQRIVAPAGPGNIPTHSIRGGSIIGSHEVQFLQDGERIGFSHIADDRSIFAKGAIATAKWLVEKRRNGEKFEGLISTDQFFDSFINA